MLAWGAQYQQELPLTQSQAHVCLRAVAGYWAVCVSSDHYHHHYRLYQFSVCLLLCQLGLVLTALLGLRRNVTVLPTPHVLSPPHGFVSGPSEHLPA